LTGDTLGFASNAISPPQAPIGTRPQSSASLIPPTPPKQLNPNAPNFKSIFNREKTEEDKAKKAAKAAEKEAKKAERNQEKKDKASRKQKERIASAETDANDSGKDTSTLDTRRSRDAPSISTADVSDSSPRESLERSHSLTPSETLGHANGNGKETLMQKLSRKSSTSQFLTFGKGKTSLFLKKPNEPATPDETEESPDGMFGRTGVASNSGSPSIGTPKDKSSALSWSAIKKMGKREKTPSLHESITSEATTGDEDEYTPEGIVSST
jgi:hypothetical protein